MTRPLELLIAATPYLPRWVVEAARSDASLGETRSLEASVLVCDLVAFTDTTNRLTEKGAEGPEESLEHLNQWYRAVLEPVRELGGDIVAFAGDSFTAIFEGPTPEGRLARSAWAARGILESASAGARIGLADGTITLGVVGAPGSRHPVILGPAPRQASLALQEAPIDGLVLAEGEGLRQLDPRELRQPAATSPLEDDEDTASSIPSLSGSAGERIERLRPFLPPSVWEGLLHPRTAGQHHPAVILFARLGLARGPELAISEVERALSRAATLVERVGGHVQKIDASDKGVVLLAFFGIPTATQAPQARAAEVALGLTEELGLAVALSSGRVFAGDLGDPLRHEFSAVGDPINLGARILQATPPGEVYCDRETADQLTTITWVALPDLTAKGFRRPVPICRLGGGFSGEFAAYVDERSPLFGREAELARLLDHCRREAGEEGKGVSPGPLVLSGALGSGKSRLLREAARVLRQEGFRVSFGHFGSYRAIRTLTEVAEGFGLQPSDDPVEVMEKLAEVYRAGPGRPVVFLEDLDLASEGDLVALREALPPLLLADGALVNTCRPEVDLPGLGERLELSGLEAKAALDLVRHHAADLSLGEAEAIARKSGGNPLFLEQLAMGAAAGQETVPTTLEDAIRERLERLDPLARRVLDTACIAPRVFDFSTFGALVAEEGRGPVSEALRSLLGALVLTAEAGRSYRFSHDLERKVVHDTLSFAERRILHEHALAVLEQREEPDWEAIFEHQEALGMSEAAGRAALAAAREAVVIRADWDVLRLARGAIERLQDPDELLEAEGLLARGLQFSADWRGSTEVAARVEQQALARGLHALSIQMAILQAGSWSFLADYAASEEALRRAISRAPLPPDLIPHLKMVRGWNAWGRGLYLEARKDLEVAAELSRPWKLLHSSIVSSLVSVLMLLGEFATARHWLESAEALIGFRPYYFGFDHLELAYRQAQLPLLRDLLREGETLQQLQPAGSRVIHEMEVQRARMHEMEGRWEEAGTARAYGITTNAEIEAHYALLEQLLANATEALCSGDFEATRERFQLLGDLAEALESGDHSATASILGAIAGLPSGPAQRDLSDLVYRNRRFAERSRRWELIVAVETLAALLEEDLELREDALEKLIAECAAREDRVSERLVLLLAWRLAQRTGQSREAERLWRAFTERLDAWGTPRWTYGTQLVDWPEGLPGSSP